MMGKLRLRRARRGAAESINGDGEDHHRSLPKLERASELDAATLLRLADLSKLDSAPAELAPSADGVALFDPAAASNGNGPVKSVLMGVADHVTGFAGLNGNGNAPTNSTGQPPTPEQPVAADDEAHAAPPPGPSGTTD